MRNRFTIVLTAIVVFMSLAVVAGARSEETTERPPTDLCERRPDHPQCQEEWKDGICERRPDHPRCQEDPKPPVDPCRRDPENPRCQDDPKPPLDPCERNPEHRRCVDRPEPEEPVDRCVRLADNPRRCVEKPSDLSHYRTLIWRLVHAGEWRLLFRLLHALGLV